ncbi:MAG: DUF2782 domain-containing protein [Burkholderiales bacterium]|nr:DUF2782 domain-containing protein [Burkholderiales bacterium]
MRHALTLNLSLLAAAAALALTGVSQNAIALDVIAQAAPAQKKPAAQPIPEPPPPPPGFELDPAAEPQVTIRKRGEDTVEEYRIAGKLYMMKVTPAGGGPSYYLIDERGDGKFARQEGPGTGVRPPMWVIHSW